MNSQTPSSGRNQPEHIAVLAEIERRWNDAAADWNVEALTRIYSADAIFFGLLPRLYVGRPEIGQYFGSYNDTLRAVTLALVEQQTLPLRPGVFAAQGFGDIVNYRRDGTIVANRVRSSFVIIETLGLWEICLHHFSDAAQGVSPSASVSVQV